jgi:hypothetical protein
VFEIEGLILKCAVSFNKTNGLSGNLRNVEVQSTSSYLALFNTQFWNDRTGIDLGSTVYLNIMDSWAGSVTSYLSNGRDPSKFHFSAREEYMFEAFQDPDGKSRAHLPVDLKDIHLRVDGTYLHLKNKPDLSLYSKTKGHKTIFSANSLKLTVGVDIKQDINIQKCLMDPSTANPQIDTTRAKYHPGFAKLIYDPVDGSYVLKIPVSVQRALKTVKRANDIYVERKNILHLALPGIP